jgi:hypothetical protein
MLGGEDLVPVACNRFKALHQEFAAVVGGKSDRRAGESRPE